MDYIIVWSDSHMPKEGGGLGVGGLKPQAYWDLVAGCINKSPGFRLLQRPREETAPETEEMLHLFSANSILPLQLDHAVLPHMYYVQ